MRYTFLPLLSVLFVAPAYSQSAGHAQPVDQGVADIDPLSRSMRQVNQGIRSDGEQSSLFMVPNDPARSIGGSTNAKPVYYRMGPGFTAKMDRGDYVVRVGEKDLGYNIAPRHDGEFLEMIPPNTVFMLDASVDPRIIAPSPTPEPDLRSFAPGGPQPVMPKRVNNQIDGRVNRMVDRRIDNRVNNQVEPREQQVGFRTQYPR